MLTLKSRKLRPCETSSLLRTRMTGCPFFKVISPGVKANFLAVTSIRFGASCDCSSLVCDAMHKKIAIERAAARAHFFCIRLSLLEDMHPLSVTVIGWAQRVVMLRLADCHPLVRGEGHAADLSEHFRDKVIATVGEGRTMLPGRSKTNRC